MKKVLKSTRTNNYGMKRKLTLSVDNKILQEAKYYRVNISSFLENKLQKFLLKLYGIHMAKVSGSNSVVFSTLNMYK